MHRRIVICVFLLAAFFMCAACGGGPRSTNADLVSIRQPTPDPTLDAVVRDLPHALAGVVAPTPTPTPTPKPAIKPPPPPIARPTPRQAVLPTATPTRR